MEKDNNPGKRKRSGKAFLGSLGEFFAELLMYAVLFGIGLGVVSLLRLNVDEIDGELVILIGLVIVLVLAYLVSLVVLLFRKNKKKDSQDKNKE